RLPCNCDHDSESVQWRTILWRFCRHALRRGELLRGEQIAELHCDGMHQRPVGGRNQFSDVLRCQAYIQARPGGDRRTQRSPEIPQVVFERAPPRNAKALNQIVNVEFAARQAMARHPRAGRPCVGELARKKKISQIVAERNEPGLLQVGDPLLAVILEWRPPLVFRRSVSRQSCMRHPSPPAQAPEIYLAGMKYSRAGGGFSPHCKAARREGCGATRQGRCSGKSSATRAPAARVSHLKFEFTNR